MDGTMDKQPLVCIPGHLCDRATWEYQIKHLSDAAIPTVIAFQGENTPEKMVQSILKQSPQTFALAGHSMGGWLALEVMRHAPERVAKLCLLNTTARPDSLNKVQLREKLIRMAKQGQFREVAEQALEQFVMQESAKQTVLEMLLRAGAQRLIDDQTAMMQRAESMSILEKIQVPTLVIHARQDHVFTLNMHKEMARFIPHAKLAIIEDCGHMSTIEQPQATTTLLRFWLNYF